MKSFNRLFSRILTIALTVLAIAFAARAQEQPLKINYRLAISQPSSHLFEVKIEVEAPATPESLDLQMPKWSPGRYAVFDFAKNVQEFHAFLGKCDPRADCMLPNASVTPWSRKLRHA